MNNVKITTNNLESIAGLLTSWLICPGLLASNLKQSTRIRRSEAGSMPMSYDFARQDEQTSFTVVEVYPPALVYLCHPCPPPRPIRLKVTGDYY